VKKNLTKFFCSLYCVMQPCCRSFARQSRNGAKWRASKSSRANRFTSFAWVAFDFVVAVHRPARLLLGCNCDAAARRKTRIEDTRWRVVSSWFCCLFDSFDHRHSRNRDSVIDLQTQNATVTVDPITCACRLFITITITQAAFTSSLLSAWRSSCSPS
jgi:hypothetical protein